MFFPENSVQAIRARLPDIEAYVRKMFVPPVPGYGPDQAACPEDAPPFRYYADDEDAEEVMDILSPDVLTDSSGSFCKPCSFSSREEEVECLLSLSGDESWTEALKRELDGMRSETFVQKVDSLISQRQLSYPAVYKAANLTRQLFSRMMSSPDYRPSKDTAVAVAFALHLNLEQAGDLLQRAGYALSRSDRRDVIIEFFFLREEYRLMYINIALDELGERPIGYR